MIKYLYYSVGDSGNWNLYDFYKVKNSAINSNWTHLGGNENHSLKSTYRILKMVTKMS